MFDEYHTHKIEYGNVYYIPTPVFFFGLKANEEALIELAPGKSILAKMMYMSETDEYGIKHVFFKLNGQTRSIDVNDKSYKSVKKSNRKVSSAKEIGAPLQGRLSNVLVKAGATIEKNDPLFTIEAMKMESTIVASASGKIKSIVLHEGVLVAQDDVVIELE
ncbi:MAG: pyruvate carboxylase [Segetibacter sp.]|nr:pyruvate carboxylase [Segetibacter sp.]